VCGKVYFSVQPLGSPIKYPDPDNRYCRCAVIYLMAQAQTALLCGCGFGGPGLAGNISPASVRRCYFAMATNAECAVN
jgi:hypothetical protein